MRVAVFDNTSGRAPLKSARLYTLRSLSKDTFLYLRYDEVYLPPMTGMSGIASISNA